MVRLRLRQWAALATGREDCDDVFAQPIASLWDLVNEEPKAWSAERAAVRKRRQAVRHLASSVDRFNHRWEHFVRKLDLNPINQRIEQYNRYYVLEKECVLGSSRLAMRHFVPRRQVTVEDLLEDHPLLPRIDVRS